MFFIRLMAVLSLVTVLCLAGVVALQMSELHSYSAEPSVWPILPK
ncbi:MAG: hypothetical protein N2652_06300 [Kiritimatiellae bacterium]|nr:hypothetical protein [Kiritimatiellia bacterium]